MGRLIDEFYDKYNYTDFHELNLDWIIKVIKKLIDTVDTLEGWKAQHEKEYNQLKKLYDDLIAGNFTPEMETALYKWTAEHTVEIIGKAIKMVFFGITDDGYFVAYIPNNWNEITFGTTGLDTFPEGVEFGHLTLTY
jgi:hypothetical protein